MMAGAADYAPFAYPDLRDPRLLFWVPAADRDAMVVLWTLVERLLTIVATAREPMLAQIKLAWWRDMLLQLAADPDALPQGEPLLADLQRDWRGSPELAPLATQVEELLLAFDDRSAIGAAMTLGRQVWALTNRDVSGAATGARWGLVAAAILNSGTTRAAALLAQVNAQPRAPGGGKGIARALLMLDRWAQHIARQNGKRSLRSEALLLLRIGILGR